MGRRRQVRILDLGVKFDPEAEAQRGRLGAAHPKESTMRFDNHTQRFYFGVDRHARSISASLRFGLRSEWKPKRSEAEWRRPRGGTPEIPNVPGAQIRGTSIAIRDAQKLERISPRSQFLY